MSTEALRVEKIFARRYVAGQTVRQQRFIYATPQEVSSGYVAVLVNQAVQRWNSERLLNQNNGFQG